MSNQKRRTFLNFGRVTAGALPFNIIHASHMQKRMQTRLK